MGRHPVTPTLASGVNLRAGVLPVFAGTLMAKVQAVTANCRPAGCKTAHEIVLRAKSSPELRQVHPMEGTRPARRPVRSRLPRVCGQAVPGVGGPCFIPPQRALLSPLTQDHMYSPEGGPRALSCCPAQHSTSRTPFNIWGFCAMATSGQWGGELSEVSPTTCGSSPRTWALVLPTGEAFEHVPHSGALCPSTRLGAPRGQGPDTSAGRRFLGRGCAEQLPASLAVLRPVSL